MRVLIINTSERTGGAAIAANRLMHALKKYGLRVLMLVRDKQTEQMSVKAIPQNWRLPVKFLWERLVIIFLNGFSRKRMWLVDLANTGTDVTKLSEFQSADVVHLHWVNQGFLSLRNLEHILQSGKRIVITMHDMWYFTSVCHYAGTCRQYETQCERCEQLGGGRAACKRVRRTFERKMQMYHRADITFVGCSQWMADMASRSALARGHRVVSIPNAIDTDVFAPQDKAEARRAFHLPADKQLLLFGAQRITDKRKGFAYLDRAMRIIVERDPQAARKLAIVVMGGDSEQVRHALPVEVVPAGYVSNEDQMAQLYNAVDAYVTPSLQDNLPNTIVEAMACGVPCVGFRVGGIPEMIDHHQNGYVARYQDAEDFAEGILWTISEERNRQLAEAARAKALATYSEESVAKRYVEIYEQ